MYMSQCVIDIQYLKHNKSNQHNKTLNKFWSHIAPFSRLYLVKVVVQLKLATVSRPIVLLS